MPEIIPRLLVGPIERIAKLLGLKDPPFLTRAQIKFITLNLDYGHQGIGTASCGPGAWPAYRLEPTVFRFGVRFTPLNG